MRPERAWRCGARCAVFGLALLLAGCAGLPFGENEASSVFTLQGRAFVKGSTAAYSIGLRWQASSDLDVIWLTAPLGQTLAQITRNYEGAMIVTADQQTYRAASVESLTSKALGWELPLAGLRHWVLGHAGRTPAPTNSVRDDQHRLRLLEQDGWRVSFDYRTDDASARPSRLQATRDDAELRLVIDALDVEVEVDAEAPRP